MTAMPPVDRARPALLASDDVAVQAFKAAHDKLHAEWVRHSRYCVRCAFGDRCRTASMLADQADVAGRRWERAAEGGR